MLKLAEAMAAPSFPAAVEFGLRVRKQRERLGLSQEALAERADLHWTYVGSVERGQRNISLKNIIRLAEALGLDPGRLVKGLRSQ